MRKIIYVLFYVRKILFVFVLVLFYERKFVYVLILICVEFYFFYLVEKCMY